MNDLVLRRNLDQFQKNGYLVNRINYVKKRNYCVSLFRKTKKEYYANLNESNVAGNKKLCKTDKVKSQEKVTLVENDKIIAQHIKIA